MSYWWNGTINILRSVCQLETIKTNYRPEIKQHYGKIWYETPVVVWLSSRRTVQLFSFLFFLFPPFSINSSVINSPLYLNLKLENFHFTWSETFMLLFDIYTEYISKGTNVYRLTPNVKQDNLVNNLACCCPCSSFDQTNYCWFLPNSMDFSAPPSNQILCSFLTGLSRATVECRLLEYA